LAIVACLLVASGQRYFVARPAFEPLPKNWRAALRARLFFGFPALVRLAAGQKNRCAAVPRRASILLGHCERVLKRSLRVTAARRSPKLYRRFWPCYCRAKTAQFWPMRVG